jgi:hypothetical protein
MSPETYGRLAARAALNSCATIPLRSIFLVIGQLGLSIRAPFMTARAQEEYKALRATIRERGTARVWVFVFGMTAWGAITVATASVASSPLAVLLPLLVLAATFEGVLSLHAGVERIGRYVQVFFEEDATGWEHAAMAFGRPAGSITTDALFSIPFFLAAMCNIGPALITEPIRAELVVVGGAHLLFVVRLISARAGTAKQRAIDLERFRQLKQPR